MGSNKIDLATLEKLCEVTFKVAETMENNREDIFNDFQNLGDTFKDQNYSEFSEEINAANNSAKKVISDIRALHRALCLYQTEIRNLL